MLYYGLYIFYDFQNLWLWFSVSYITLSSLEPLRIVTVIFSKFSATDWPPGCFAFMNKTWKFTLFFIFYFNQFPGVTTFRQWIWKRWFSKSVVVILLHVRGYMYVDRQTASSACVCVIYKGVNIYHNREARMKTLVPMKFKLPDIYSKACHDHARAARVPSTRHVKILDCTNLRNDGH